MGWNRSLLSLKWPVLSISFPFRQYCRSYRCKADFIYQLEMRLSRAIKNQAQLLQRLRISRVRDIKIEPESEPQIVT